MDGGSEADKTTTPKRQHKIPRENAHINVLGMDGTDLQVPPPTGVTNNASLNGNRSSPKRNESPLGAPEDIERGENSVHRNISSNSLDNREDPMLAGRELPGSRTSWWGKVWGGTYNQVAPQQPDDINTARYTADSLMSTNNGVETNGGAATVEDQLRQDCHFFYQGFDEQPSPERRQRYRPFSSPRNTSMTNNSREGALFFAKYQQLNQEMREDYDRHDLALEEEGDQVQIRFNSDSSINVLDVKHSSLFYEQDGKLLMKLPRDQMRLMMDNDLEPGIVSVQQWRKAEDQYQGLTSVSQMEMTPPLKYVLTVPDDLYRRVVSEMSYRLMPPCWGFFKCCHYHDDHEHADIRLALVILTVTFALVFIFTMEWRTT